MAEIHEYHDSELIDYDREGDVSSREIEDVRRFYGDRAANLVHAGWTVDAAINHVTGQCDILICGGEH